ncbi:hypothetical protein [Ponticoccus litoralis]|uniref:Uncharacterized protein n=1 Tax=Ponticoccus litoralis TaxID=422297 RepID=A0AAW9SHY7_9RHOB
MRYLTDRKRATGLGASGQGTQHHYQMLISSILMVVVVPLFVITFGAGMGGTREEVIAYFSRPLARHRHRPWHGRDPQPREERGA